MVKEIRDATEKIKGSKAKREPQKLDPLKEQDKLKEEGIKSEEKNDSSAKKPDEAKATKTLDDELERRGRTRAATSAKLEETIEATTVESPRQSEVSEALAYNQATNGKPANAYGTIYGPAGQKGDAAAVYSRSRGGDGRESEDHGEFYTRATRQNDRPEQQYQRGFGADPNTIRESIDPLAKLSAYARR
ncbi:hypothetical protein HY641_05230 [Candidatus Woesearchaeota archaeon]|nr:hypothetical protein [Candidatus Woesearchaeota archaeon]